ncbi:unnamed protein product [Tetraodon nigroviridis]|uniref:(spotted green pufferfish) hypothetical protein n=1 Tax=Tetraodon nigroviridis TaxID=99883 RepID=Q4S7U0_TETNG|nr:unnamed protein product [Tetraodon nigroviridis]
MAPEFTQLTLATKLLKTKQKASAATDKRMVASCRPPTRNVMSKAKVIDTCTESAITNGDFYRLLNENADTCRIRQSSDF